LQCIVINQWLHSLEYRRKISRVYYLPPTVCVAVHPSRYIETLIIMSFCSPLHHELRVHISSLYCIVSRVLSTANMRMRHVLCFVILCACDVCAEQKIIISMEYQHSIPSKLCHLIHKKLGRWSVCYQPKK